MAKRTSPKPDATAVVTTAPTGVVTDTTTGVVTDAATGVVNDTTTGVATDTSQIEEATVLVTEGSPTPPELGNEGTAAAAGEGQLSLANPAGSSERLDYQQQVRQLADDYAPRGLQAAVASLGGEPSLVVTGPKKGRWRIGRKFGPEPVTVPVSELTEDDMKALVEDKALTITAVAPPY